MDQHTLQHKDILLIEDDSFILDIYETKLSEAGYNVTAASNGREAVEHLEESVPQLILLDIVMPYMDGFDVLEAMNANPAWKDIPVIMLTNLSQKEDIEKAMALGADDYLIKSHFTPSEVLGKVEKFIQQGRP